MLRCSIIYQECNEPFLVNKPLLARALQVLRDKLDSLEVKGTRVWVDPRECQVPKEPGDQRGPRASRVCVEPRDSSEQP